MAKTPMTASTRIKFVHSLSQDPYLYRSYLAVQMRVVLPSYLDEEVSMIVVASARHVWSAQHWFPVCAGHQLLPANWLRSRTLVEWLSNPVDEYLIPFGGAVLSHSARSPGNRNTISWEIVILVERWKYMIDI